MITFVNAKINIGLQIVRRREDGYHDLHTLFYPVGIYAGTPVNPTEFCDILEVAPSEHSGIHFKFTGREVDCPEEKNLVCRAARLFFEEKGESLLAAIEAPGLLIQLDKHLPDGAGMGGGSADASFTLKALNSMLRSEERLPDSQLAEMALSLGADCPFFIYNRPMLGEGVGEKLEDVDIDLSGCWLVIVKPRVYVSTREAFAGVTPHEAGFDLRELARRPISEWRAVVHNDFEDSIFPLYPELGQIKERIYDAGALYVSMSGSGSSIYGIFDYKEKAQQMVNAYRNATTIEGAYLLKL